MVTNLPYQVMDETQMMHGQDWQGEDLSGWLLTEKLNGCRAYWDGANLWARSGRKIAMPKHWADELPGIHLDCELFDGYEGVSRAAAAIKHGKFTPSMHLVAFDAPTINGTWQSRISAAAQLLSGSLICRAIQATECESNDHAFAIKDAIQGNGGEGLMARTQHLNYTHGRTRQMLKVKFYGSYRQYLDI